MTLHRLAIRTKKSLSGLYSSQKENAQSCRPVPTPGEPATKLTITPPKAVSSTVDEFGVLRSDDDASPGKDSPSPSRRHRLLGSLRSMRSLRTLRSSHSTGSSKRSEEEPVKTDSPSTPVRETLLVSLNFEASPVDEPMFGPMTRTTSGSSSLKVHHSSPITVPTASRNTTPMAQGTPPGLAAFVFPANTVPDSPAPLQRLSVQEAIVNNANKGGPGPGYSDLETEVAPPLATPMPGTNLPLEDVAAPGIMVTSPSAPSMQVVDQPGYFDGVVIPDETGCERTKTLETESGFPTFDDVNENAIKAANAELDAAALPVCPAAPNLDAAALPVYPDMPKLEPASFDESFPIAPNEGTSATMVPKTPSGSNDYGEDLRYVYYDSPESVTACKEHMRKSHVSTNCEATLEATCALYDGTGYGSEATSSSHQWTDNSKSATTETTELTELTTPEEAAAEAKLMAAIKELDGATLPAQPQSPVDDKKALQDIIRAYAHLRESTGLEDEGGVSLPLQDAITQEMKDEVETCIRVMNRSLGG